jgi:hypothetical protein
MKLLTREIVANCQEAAARYEETAIQVAETLNDLNASLEYWHERIQKGGDQRMYRHLIELFVSLFEVLVDIFTGWHMKGLVRAKACLNQGTIERLKQRRKKIRNLGLALERAERGYQYDKSSAERQEIMLEVQTNRKEIQGLRQELSKLTGSHNAPALAEHKTRVIQNLRKHSAHMLEDIVAESVPSDTKAITEEPSTISEEEIDILTDTDLSNLSLEPSSESTLEPQVSNILNNLQNLRKRLARHLDAVAGLAEDISSLGIDAEVQSRLTSFLEVDTSDALWIQGPWNVETPSQNTNTAVILYGIIQRNDDTPILYFNSVNMVDDAFGTAANRKQNLMDLILMIIMQLIYAVPEERRPCVRPLVQHLEALNAGPISIEDALDVLVAVRQACPSTVYVLLDHCHTLGGSYDYEHEANIRRVMDILCKMASSNENAEHGRTLDSGPQSLVTKVCFTTDGNMETLADVYRDGLVDCIEYQDEADRSGCDPTAPLE